MSEKTSWTFDEIEAHRAKYMHPYVYLLITKNTAFPFLKKLWVNSVFNSGQGITLITPISTYHKDGKEFRVYVDYNDKVSSNDGTLFITESEAIKALDAAIDFAIHTINQQKEDYDKQINHLNEIKNDTKLKIK